MLAVQCHYNYEAFPKKIDFLKPKISPMHVQLQREHNNDSSKEKKGNLQFFKSPLTFIMRNVCVFLSKWRDAVHKCHLFWESRCRQMFTLVVSNA